MAMATVKKKIFSFPLSPILTAKDLNNLIVPFLQRHKELIYDIYFTCRVPPFTQDAMGIVIKKEDRLKTIFSDAMVIKRLTGIRVSATFNNTGVPPTDENLEIFVKNLKPLYTAGLRSMTIPHTIWLKTGVIQKMFPDMFIKNTVLRRVRTAQEFWFAAEAGFHFINVDRILLRDRKSLQEIKKAQSKFAEKTGKYVYISILANESCLGKCPFMDEHHFFNNCIGCGSSGTDQPYFTQKIGGSCPRGPGGLSSTLNPAFFLKMCNITYFREDFEELLNLVDVIKMHGRNSPDLLATSLNFIKNYAQNKNEVIYGNTDPLKRIITDLNIPVYQIDKWRRMIKDCRFECWDCNFCDALVETAIAGEQKKSLP